LKSKGADDLDCLCKTKDYDSLWKVKADDIDSLHKTKNYDSLGNVKKIVIVLTKDSNLVFGWSN